MIAYKIANIQLPIQHKDEALYNEIATRCHIQGNQIMNLEILKQSIDARKKPQLYWVYTLSFEVEHPIVDKWIKKNNIQVHTVKKYTLPKKRTYSKRPVVIGSGPAGLFAAYLLAIAGMCPIIVERGAEADKRQEDIDSFHKTGQLKPSSNIQFGEGGAGTFSDGKLNTGVKDKFLRKGFVLDTFIKYGADPSIGYMNKPHIGTDYLILWLKNMRQAIEQMGGTYYFNTRMTKLIYEDGHVRGVHCIRNGEPITFETDHVVLAIGHSARDTFRQLHDDGITMEAKPFAMGLRIEHPQEIIDTRQYGRENAESGFLPAADYKLTHQSSNGRGVYSFCMCPGGLVVNASSHEGYLVCNGMSYFARDLSHANSAIIVSISRDDYEDEGVLAGVEFQEKWERKAYELTRGTYALPTQSYGAFYKSVTGLSKVPLGGMIQPMDSSSPSMTMEADLSRCLPRYVAESVVEGIEAFGRKIKGFNHENARLVGVETRTSSPVRILRDEHFLSNITGLYPAGEGAGYAGGIMSAAMDGIKVAEAILDTVEI